MMYKKFIGIFLACFIFSCSFARGGRGGSFGGRSFSKGGVGHFSNSSHRVKKSTINSTSAAKQNDTYYYSSGNRTSPYYDKKSDKQSIAQIRDNNFMLHKYLVVTAALVVVIFGYCVWNKCCSIKEQCSNTEENAQ